MDKSKSTIVISAINFTEGGPLTILNECLEYASAHLSKKYVVVALVHDECLFDFPNIRYISFPRSKKSWFLRVYYEYFFFRGLSSELKPYLWLSLHDITPNVTANIKAVYCHNPAPFFKISFASAWLDPRFALFSTFYSYLYSINIHKNDYVIVQQDWLRREFVSRYSLANVVVSHPEISKSEIDVEKKSRKFTCLFPAFPRVFKNFEVICKAAEILTAQNINDIDLVLTISGKENRYAQSVFSNNKSSLIKFVGVQHRGELYELYANSDCMIFPSKLETWGLPLTEYMASGKPILAANLPYAHETLGVYNKAKFFDPDDHILLAKLIIEVRDGIVVYDQPAVSVLDSPFARGWEGVFDVLSK